MCQYIFSMTYKRSKIHQTVSSHTIICLIYNGPFSRTYIDSRPSVAVYAAEQLQTQSEPDHRNTLSTTCIWCCDTDVCVIYSPSKFSVKFAFVFSRLKRMNDHSVERFRWAVFGLLKVGSGGGLLLFCYIIRSRNSSFK